MSAVTLSSSNSGPVTNNNNNNTNNGAIELTESGGRALKLQTDAPHLVSLGGGRLSTAVTLHPIPQGRITLGSGPGVDIVVQGTGVEPLHCHIENSGGIVTLYPLSDNLSVDGVNVTKPVRLSQGVMLTIGRSNYLRFNHPAEAQLMKSVLPNARISMAPIKFNLENNEDVQYVKKPPTIPRRNSDEDPPSNNIQMKVSKFEYLAAQNFKQSISPKVFSSNSVTVNTPAKDVLGRAPPDLQDFAKNLPQPAINYSDSSYDKQKNKTPDRQFFGRKSPQYVNVAVNNDTKAINNRVAIYENGCIPKQPNVLLNVNLDQQPKNELNNMNNKTINTNQVNKSLNVNRTPPPVSSFNPSPSFNRNQPQYFRSITPNPSPNLNVNLNRQSSGSLNELNKSVSEIFDHVSNEITQRREDAETRRNQAHADRVKEQEIEKAEQARLEEILSMCAEYERQAQWEKNNKPTPNRIKTNGSLPRDKRQCPPSPYSSSSPIHATPSPSSRDGSIFQFDLDKAQNEENCSYENVSLNRLSPRDTNSKFYYENVEIRSADNGHSNYINSYENVHIIQPNSISPYPHSPRTRIKTIPTLSKESSPKDATQLIDHKFSISSAEQTLLENLNKEIPSENNECFDTPYRKPTPTKNVLLIEKNCDSQSVAAQNTFERNKLMKEKNDADKQKLETLKKKKHEISTTMANTKRKMTEIRMQEEELNRELEMERALINGEFKSKLLELEEVENRKQKLIDQARDIELKMKDCQITQGEHQDDCKRKLDQAQENMNQVEQKLNDAKKGSSEYQELFEEFLSAQEILDNERKTFEDLEFHHLEEEADWLATREEIQREILDLSKRIEIVKTQITELEQQTVDTSQNNIKDLAVLETQLIKCLQSLEEKRINLKTVESEMRNISKQESDQEVSSDSDCDKPKGTNEFRMANMSCSFIDTRTSSIDDVIYNMSQSFNEKMLQEKSILEGGMVATRCPSQDDIDRISKVTSSAPISIEDGRGSLGKKTIESLKEIERNRQLHLVQEGSKVIEEERRRVFELKQRAQNEVRTEWAKRQQNCTSLTSIESDDLRNSITGSDEIDQKRASREEKQNQNDIVKKLHSEPESPESPRPLSETSDISVEVGPLGKRKPRQNLDKTRPLTRYLPIRSSELDLRQHIESAGHQVVLCPHVIINSSTCRGFLHKKGSKLNGWSRRWFVLDRQKRTLVYYADKSEKKVRGGAYFQAIEEVYLDHSNSVKSPNPHLTFIIKTHQRHYYLMAPSPEAMRIWIDVVFTGAEGYQEFEHGT